MNPSSGSLRAPLSAVDVTSAFRAAGVEPGDILLVHSGLWMIGPLQDRPASPIETFFTGVQTAVGLEGTIAVPAGNRTYGGFGDPFDVRHTPPGPDLGVFSKYVSGLASASRSLNPVSGMAAVGERAPWLCGGGSGTSFGADSPYERLHSVSGKIAFVGVDLRYMTYAHYVEYRVGVPHLYSKFYPRGISANGRPLTVQISAQVRYLDFEVRYRLEELTDILEEAGLVTKAPLGSGWIRVTNATDVYSFLKDKLVQDFWFLLHSAPAFVSDRIPMDGPTGEPVE